MKKKPSMIFSILINILNNLDIGKDYSINEISEKSGLHWKTTEEYLKTLLHLFKFSPKFKINENSNRVQLLKHSEYFKSTSISQKMLVFLYENKAFDPESAIVISDFLPNIDIKNYLEELVSETQIENVNGTNKYFVTKEGKINVISLYSSLTKAIFDFEPIKEEISLDKEDQRRLIKEPAQLNEIYVEIKKLNKRYRELSSKMDNLYNIYERGVIIEPKIEDIKPIFQAQYNITSVLNFQINNLQPEFDSSNEVSKVKIPEVEPYMQNISRKRKSRK